MRDFFAALAADGPIRLIAEVKKASPSKGVIRADFDPVAIAQIYERHGATLPQRAHRRAAIFRAAWIISRPFAPRSACPCCGRISFSTRTRSLEARAAGADAVLLIAECLDDCNLRKLLNETCELGMTPLVELYEPENLPRVFDAGATLIGVNNRDLRTFEVDLEHTLRLRDARCPTTACWSARAASRRTPTSNAWMRPASTRCSSAKR